MSAGRWAKKEPAVIDRRYSSEPPLQLDELEREIAETDAEIDNLVYELYGITEEERKIIEGASNEG